MTTPIPPLLLAAKVLLVLVAFAANSVLCRQALAHTAIDPATFTLIRLGSGAVVLTLLARWQAGRFHVAGSWAGAAALTLYAVCFSFAYISLPSGTGALLLFGAVQVTMIAKGLLGGERLTRPQSLGLMAAIGGVILLMAPGVTAPDPLSALLMIAAGMGWGAYSLLGRNAGSGPLPTSAGNFIRATPMAAVPALFLLSQNQIHWDDPGITYALASGAIASGLGYALWYRVLPALAATTAATVQLSVPIMTALGGIFLLGESLTPRLALSTLAVLGGIALVVRTGKKR